MFEAYSKELGKIVNANDVYNFKEIFFCPNPNCHAKFKIKSINGKRAKHFAKTMNSTHIKNCPFSLHLNKKDYIESENLIKSDLLSFFQENNKFDLKNDSLNASIRSESNKEFRRRYIKTPKQLLYYCLVNNLNTKYLSKMTVDDIILDSRNLKKYGRYYGIEGIRLLYGVIEKTFYKNDCAEIIVKISTPKKSGGEVSLHAHVETSRKQLTEIRNYILETFNENDNGKKIAVLGNWQKTVPYNIKCSVKNASHIIYKFIN